VRGQVKIRCFTGNPENILSYQPLTDASGGRAFKLTRRGIQNKLIIASIDGINDRNEAELLKGTELFAPASALPAKTENQWSHDELTGLEARISDGRVYGRVIGLYNFGAGDILEIELAEGKTEMLPFKKPFVGNIRPDEGYLIVFPPEYVEAKEEE